MAKSAGYNAAIEHFAYATWTRMIKVYNEAVATGDFTRFNTIHECPFNDPEFGEDFEKLDAILSAIAEAYDIPMITVLQDMDDVQDRFVVESTAKQLNDELWDLF